MPEIDCSAAARGLREALYQSCFAVMGCSAGRWASSTRSSDFPNICIRQVCKMCGGQTARYSAKSLQYYALVTSVVPDRSDFNQFEPLPGAPFSHGVACTDKIRQCESAPPPSYLYLFSDENSTVPVPVPFPYPWLVSNSRSNTCLLSTLIHTRISRFLELRLLGER